VNTEEVSGDACYVRGTELTRTSKNKKEHDRWRELGVRFAAVSLRATQFTRDSTAFDSSHSGIPAELHRNFFCESRLWPSY
jgi:hypothetical protein